LSGIKGVFASIIYSFCNLFFYYNIKSQKNKELFEIFFGFFARFFGENVKKTGVKQKNPLFQKNMQKYIKNIKIVFEFLRDLWYNKI
jgi:hypothetical protein